MTTDQLRKAYLDFFRSKNHKVFSSDSLVPADDPSLLFTGAGMNQFKPYFLGLKKDLKRATSCQKCLRTADLDRVGKTAYHHSFFEMLGNFSFGDYFKEEAIEWGWEFVTKVLGLPKEKLWVSVYQDDDEAASIWQKKIGLPAARIVRFGAEDNFWPSNAPKDGPNGPCGPCSEIYVGETPGKGVEIWNLVFTQFDRQSDGSLKDLPQRNIDTGMGLERTAAVLQGVDSNFDTDNFVKLRAEVKRLLDKSKAKGSEKETVAHENAVMDHIRAVVFSIADGALPSNLGQGYVIRKIIRLASEHMQKAGALRPGTLHKLVPAVVAIYGNVYPEIKDREKTVAGIIENEEASFLEVLRTRVPELETLLKKTEPNDPAINDLFFKYYDTYGLTLDQMQFSATRTGRQLSLVEFNNRLEEQKKRSRESSKIAGEIFSKNSAYEFVDDIHPTKFLGYEKTAAEGRLLRIIENNAKRGELKAGQEGILIFDQSPFYAEAGGQVGDTGVISGSDARATVLDTQYIDKCIAHRVHVDEGVIREGSTLKLLVDAERRDDIMKNHTATHLLHAALRKVLGEHVKQSGSLVAPDRLRFDFTHFKAVEPEKLAEIEALVNGEIKKNTHVDKKIMSKEEAMKAGAIAFFGEKYGDEVRVLTIGDFSKELCGGTHLENVGQIGNFKITSESSIQAGVRRIEAVTGRGACEFIERQDDEIKLLAREFGSKNRDLLQTFKIEKDKLSLFKSRLNATIADIEKQRVKVTVEKESEKYKGVSIISRFDDKVRLDMFSLSVGILKTLPISFVALFEGKLDEKVVFAVGASPDLTGKGFHSGKVIKSISEKIGGNGGGRPDYAVGGGKDTSKVKVKEAFEFGKEIIKRELDVLLPN